jgi:hypothetical protein
VGLLSWFRGKKEPASDADKTAAIRDVPEAKVQTCPTCARRLLPGAICPFCHPQHFGDDLPEGTIASAYDSSKTATLGGVLVAGEMAKQHGAKGFLHVIKGANKGASVLLGTRFVSIGRKADENTLAINDPGCSSKHCEVRPVHGGFEIVDLDSKNGTFVNDQRVKQKPLQNRDVIGFANTRIYVGIF